MARYYSINLEISRNSTTLGLKALLQAQCYSVHEDHQVGYGTYQMECVWLKNALLPIVAAFRFGIALNVRFIRNGMCAKNITHIFAVRKNNNSVISSICICCFASCYSVKLCTLAAHAFRSKHYKRKCTG